MSEDAVRSMFQPADRYRISRYCHTAGTTTHGAMLSGVCFVLSGRCRLKVGSPSPIDLQAGQFIEMPCGSYEIFALGSEDLEMVLVWELPGGIRGQEPGGERDPGVRPS